MGACSGMMAGKGHFEGTDPCVGDVCAPHTGIGQSGMRNGSAVTTATTESAAGSYPSLA